MVELESKYVPLRAHRRLFGLLVDLLEVTASPQPSRLPIRSR